MKVMEKLTTASLRKLLLQLDCSCFSNHTINLNTEALQRAFYSSFSSHCEFGNLSFFYYKTFSRSTKQYNHRHIKDIEQRAMMVYRLQSLNFTSSQTWSFLYEVMLEELKPPVLTCDRCNRSNIITQVTFDRKICLKTDNRWKFMFSYCLTVCAFVKLQCVVTW